MYCSPGLWVVPDAWSQGSRRRVHRREERTTPRRQHDGWPRLGPAWAPPATAPILRAVRRCAGHTGTSRVCESAIFVPQGSPLRWAQPWRCVLLAREGTKPGVGQAKTARARHAPRAPTQARSQNDGYTALILRAGSRRAGVPHPRAACHRLVQRVVGSDVQHLLSVLSGRGDTRLSARDGGRNGAGCRLCHRAHGRTAMPTRRPFTH